MRASGNDVFASKSDQGGGVVLDCVHDIDIATWLLGPMEHVVSRVATIGEDDIDAEDYALVLLKGNNGLVSSFHFDFIGRLKKRGCENCRHRGFDLLGKRRKKSRELAGRLANY